MKILHFKSFRILYEIRQAYVEWVQKSRQEVFDRKKSLELKQLLQERKLSKDADDRRNLSKRILRMARRENRL